jgi:hypothetical protein
MSPTPAKPISATKDVRLDTLTPHPENPRRADTTALRESLARFGQYRPIVVQKATNHIIAGNHTARAAAEEGWTTVKATIIDVDDATARAILVADNRLADLGTYEQADLTTLLRTIDREGGLGGTGYTTQDLADLLAPTRAASKPLTDSFLVPPFSVLDSRQGYWRSRKAEWTALGIRSELGREGDLAMASLSGRVPDYYDQKRTIEAYLGRTVPNPEFEERYLRLPDNESTMGATGTSIFDPVLTEVALRWFAPTGGHILDPFAGGSVRGVVASLLGHTYTGVDLSEAQNQANRDQWTAIDAALRGDSGPPPTWVTGDAATDIPDEPADMILTCPPYFDLEKYSDDPADLSNMTWPAFRKAYETAIQAALARLKNHRFAVWVVSDVRDKAGHYRGLTAETVRIFQKAGAHLYNEAILVTPTGSLAVTAGKQMKAGRKLGRQHQNVLIFGKGEGPIAEAVERDFTEAWRLGRNHDNILVFAKGDGRKAADQLPDINVDDLPQL